MGNVTVGTLFRKSTRRDMSGNIIDLRDDANGGWIVRDRQIVNQARIDEMAKIEEDKRKAATAETQAVQAPQEVIEQRLGNPSASNTKMEALEKRIDNQDAKLDAILLALQK